MRPEFRKPTRIMAYDYRDPGPYFVTICLNTRVPLFGTISNDGVLHPNAAGQMVAAVWQAIPQQFSAVELDDVIVMPDHLHGILTLGTSEEDGDAHDLGSVIGWFKMITVKRYGRGVKDEDWLPYEAPLWQRSFYDHIVRSEADLARCQEYILGNPARRAEAQGPL